MPTQFEPTLEWCQTTLRSVRDAIVATDANAKVVFMNPAAEQLTGWAFVDVADKPLREVLDLRTGTARKVVEHFIEEFECSSDITNLGQTILRRRDGSEVPIDDSAAPICANDGTLIGFVVVFRDVTARCRQEEDNARLLEEVRRASRAKDEFLAMLGHELRNPLAPIVTTVQLLKLKAGDSLLQECSVIERQLHHVLRLVDDLMDASRISRGKVEISTRPTEMDEVAFAAIEMVRPLFRQRRQTIDVSMTPDLRVLGDPDRLGQVVANLLRNAGKYSEAGSRVGLHGTREGPDVVLTVQDQGIGIEKDRLDAIFEPFVQAPLALDRAGGGLGLGLAIARKLVELHSGIIVAQSDGPGTGSAFTVRLPALDGAAPSRGPREAVAGEGASAQQVRVLIVDDNMDAADALAGALSVLGYAPVTALDGPQALTLAAAAHPSIALLDIGLPGMDGYELARYLRAARNLEHLKLVALTGYGLATDRERALAAGFDEHLAKPASLEVIQEVMERLVRMSPA